MILHYLEKTGSEERKNELMGVLLTQEQFYQEKLCTIIEKRLKPFIINDDSVRAKYHDQYASAIE